MIKGVIFDLGDTLASQAPLIGSQAAFAGASALLPIIREHCTDLPSAAQLAQDLGEHFQAAVAGSYESDMAQPPTEAVFTQALSTFDCTLPPHRIPAALDCYFSPFYHCMEPLAEVIPTLTLARGVGLKLGLVANVLWGADLLRDRLRRIGLAGLLSASVYSSEIGWMKPFPATFREVIRRFGVEAGQAVMVGDDPFADVDGAQRAGIRAIWKRARPGQALPPGVRPDVTIDDIRQLLPAVAELM